MPDTFDSAAPNADRGGLEPVNRDWFFLPIRAFRRKRMSRFLTEFKLNSSTRKLDVGGTDDYWELAGCTGEVILLNVQAAVETPRSANLRYVAGGGRTLPHADGSFDIGFSQTRSSSTRRDEGAFSGLRDPPRAVRRADEGLHHCATPALVVAVRAVGS